jgi:hypothetical protein
MTAPATAHELDAFLRRNGGRTPGSAAVVLEGLAALVSSECVALSVWDPVLGRHRALARRRRPAHAARLRPRRLPGPGAAAAALHGRSRRRRRGGGCSSDPGPARYAPTARSNLLELVAAGPVLLVLDGPTYVASNGAALLAEAADRAGARGHRLRVEVPPGPGRHALELSGLLTLLG